MVHFISFWGIFIKSNFLQYLHTAINFIHLWVYVYIHVQHEFIYILLPSTKVQQITLVKLQLRDVTKFARQLYLLKSKSNIAKHTS
jgi:hypothetical protein